jgi:hypothetical protein
MRSRVQYMLLAIVVAMAAIMAGCDSDNGVPLTPSNLYGLWANEDAGTWRVFAFAAADDGAAPDLAGRSNVYRVHLYPDGQSAAEVQRGTFAITDGHLVTSVIWADDASFIGRDFANIVEGLEANTLRLESTSASSGTRVYKRVSALP